MKQKFLTLFLFLLLLSVVASIFIFNTPFQFPQALAVTEWTDTFNVYTNITVVEQAIHNITNTYDFPIDIKVSITDVTNIAKLYFYKTIGNGTEFIYIKEGVTIRTSNTYPGLQKGETLTFDLTAKPAITLGIGEDIVVKKEVEIYPSAIPPPPPIIFPSVAIPLDIAIIKLPTILYQPFQPKFTATITATNKGTIGADVFFRWWTTDAEGTVYDAGATTIYIEGKETKQIDMDVLTPKQSGFYTLHVESATPAKAKAEIQFQVTAIPTWLLLTIIIIVIATAIYIIKKKR
jgi:hypothetical protein